MDVGLMVVNETLIRNMDKGCNGCDNIEEGLSSCELRLTSKQAPITTRL